MRCSWRSIAITICVLQSLYLCTAFFFTENQEVHDPATAFHKHRSTVPVRSALPLVAAVSLPAAESAVEFSKAAQQFDGVHRLLHELSTNLQNSKFAGLRKSLSQEMTLVSAAHAGVATGTTEVVASIKALLEQLEAVDTAISDLSTRSTALGSQLPNEWAPEEGRFITAPGDMGPGTPLFASLHACRAACSSRPACVGITRSPKGECQLKSQTKLGQGEGWYSELALPRPTSDHAGSSGTAATRKLSARLALAVQEAKRAVKMGKHLSSGPEVAASYAQTLQAGQYPNSDFENAIRASLSDRSRGLVVATFNLWGLTDWEGRKSKIVDMLRSSKPDIIGFQEVYQYADGTNQLQQLRDLGGLEGYQLVFQPCHKVKEEAEGLAVFTRFPVLSTESVGLTRDKHWSTDPNQRCGLMATIDASSVSPQLSQLQVFVTHLSFADTQQCLNTVALQNWANEQWIKAQNHQDPGMVTQIFMGDFNTYFGWEWPMDVMTEPLNAEFFNLATPCTAPQKGSQVLQEVMLDMTMLPKNNIPPLAAWADDLKDVEPFRDTWTSIHSNKHRLGFTFSNVGDTTKLWDDNPPCRPDRILVRGPLKVYSAHTIGDTPALLWAAGGASRLSDHLGVQVVLAAVTEASRTQEDQAYILSVRDNLEAMLQRQDKLAKETRQFEKETSDSQNRLDEGGLPEEEKTELQQDLEEQSDILKAKSKALLHAEQQLRTAIDRDLV